MQHYKFLKKYKTYTPSYKLDFIRYGFNSFLFGFFLEIYLIFGKKYEFMYKSAYSKELQRVRDLDNQIDDKIRKNLFKQQKLKELKLLEEKLDKVNQKPIR
jgi:hypothetical protein